MVLVETFAQIRQGDSHRPNTCQYLGAVDTPPLAWSDWIRVKPI
jgi:hypothetical protein